MIHSPIVNKNGLFPNQFFMLVYVDNHANSTGQILRLKMCDNWEKFNEK